MNFSAKYENAIAFKYFYLKLVQCGSFEKWTFAWEWPSKTETHSSWLNFNVILNEGECMDRVALEAEVNV
jgi:hypothetical protein